MPGFGSRGIPSRSKAPPFPGQTAGHEICEPEGEAALFSVFLVSRWNGKFVSCRAK